MEEMNADYLVISCSLNPDSRSRILALSVFEALKRNHNDVEWLDLKDFRLPLCDGASAYSHPDVSRLAKKIASSKCVLLGVPIYNYDVSASAKNLVELTGKAWSEKVVGFLCAAGGRSSYMSVMGIANSLMLDFRCLIIPRFVYADGSAFSGTRVEDEKVQERVLELAETAKRLTGALLAKA